VNAYSNASLTTKEGSVSVVSFSNVSLEAQKGTFAVSVDSNLFSLYAASNINVSTSNDLNVQSTSNILVGTVAGDLQITVNSSNMSLTMDHLTNDTSLFTSNNLNLSASNSYALNARSNVTLNASKGSLDLYANDSNMYMTLDYTTNDVALYGQNDIKLTSSNTFTANVASNLAINTFGGELNAYARSNLNLYADNSNMYVTFNMPTDSITGYALSNITFDASNNFAINAKSNMSVTSSNIVNLAHFNASYTASNNLTVSASNTLTLAYGTLLNLVGAGDQAFTARSNIEFFITSASNDSASPVLNIAGNLVEVRGDLLITGSITTSNVFNTTVIQNTLKVADRTIVLADLGSNFNFDGPYDGPTTNSGAGILIDGLPAIVGSIGSNINSNIELAYQKSFTWNYGTNGVTDLGGADTYSSEAQWQLRGGAFHIINSKVNGTDVKEVDFAFRIGSNDELEIIKKWWSTTANAYTTKRIARFGRML
jgi:hypothetical protein